MPVTLPPGRLKLTTSPIAIGSSPAEKTIGMVCGFGGLCRNGPAARNDDSNSAANQVGRQFREPIVVVVRRAKFDGDVAAFDVAGFPQALAECRPRQLGRLGRCSVEISDHRHRRLLRARRERPRCRAAAKQDDEIAPSYT
jgi:hypothetical protein